MIVGSQKKNVFFYPFVYFYFLIYTCLNLKRFDLAETSLLSNIAIWLLSWFNSFFKLTPLLSFHCLVFIFFSITHFINIHWWKCIYQIFHVSSKDGPCKMMWMLIMIIIIIWRRRIIMIIIIIIYRANGKNYVHFIILNKT